MFRFLLSLALIVLLAAVTPLTVVAAIASLEEAMAEMSLGKDNAPVTMVEYSSLGCPHCAAFHFETLPKIKTDYIDTGKLRLVYRDFPLGTPSLAAAMVARCAGRDRYFGFVELLFRSQSQWSQSNNPLEAIARVVRFGGMSEADINDCLKYQPLLESIRKGAETANEKLKINSTPSFIIGSEVISGALPYEHFKKAIDKALKK
ncbi:MAG: DsbA family protein [Rhodospirillales bacterium]|nr:DsbA family protein [Rhodospirillales bacterium]